MRSWCVFLTWGVLLRTAIALFTVDFKYHNYNDMTAVLRAINKQYPDLTRLYTIGKSVQGRELWVLMIASKPGEDTLLRPNVKYVANMHGNEAIGRELLLHLAAYLVNNYSLDPSVTALLDNTKIHLMPSMNPDGFEMSAENQCVSGQGRYNARGYDLNRNFPDFFKTNDKITQPETKAVREWLDQFPFILSGNLHGGALVASYPYDNSRSPQFTSYGVASPTPDNDVFQHLALVYSTTHKTMHYGTPCRDGSPSFPNGTTNGAAWYPLTGGMQDYNYVWAGCMEITLELSCCKYPPAQRLRYYWDENERALLRYIREAHRGVKGLILDNNNNPIRNAKLKIRGRDAIFRSSKLGEYWRILLPGRYIIEAHAEGFMPSTVPFTVNEGSVTILNLTMYPQTKVEEVTEHTWHFLFNEPQSTEAAIVNQATTVNDNDNLSADSLDTNLTNSVTESFMTSSTEQPVARAVAESGVSSTNILRYSSWVLTVGLLSVISM